LGVRARIPLYLTDRFTGGPPKQEPLNQLVPLVAFSFDSPTGQKAAATANPGLSYVAVAWPLAGEAIIPLNRECGRGVGFRAQLLFFLDEVSPLFATVRRGSLPIRFEIPGEEMAPANPNSSDRVISLHRL
jgi:hypothetical protein